MYGEDVELSYRLRDCGHRLRYVPQATVWHHTYEQAAQVKPLQFLGSTLANVLLRCRYGHWYQVLSGFAMYFGLFLVRPQFPGQRRHLLRNFGKLLYLAPSFLPPVVAAMQISRFVCGIMQWLETEPFISIQSQTNYHH